ncbi:type II secretion system minor pseudopilin GspJ [Sphingomicrobium lutaoense]|uniref:Type II secretion system protein J n=1 Tax=Sphingomicrobium lutaoense TaxID=515949 RepID=A0A839Z483_9SPHN|nr:type II secretion system minor pseudopilin GspJ [Sphingomicrobium lutaoense]MBB3764897.1 general secretion pathway protein J [Sphingomicrobium lutaoense]
MRNGFTLIEMMVALSIFAILSAGGVLLLRGSANTQGAVDRQLAALSSTERLRLLLASDLGQAVPRPTRGGDGAARPAFSGDAQSMQFVRGGFEPVSDAPEPTIARVRWLLAGGRLVRRQFGRLDGGDEPALDAELEEGVSEFRLSYRDGAGGWVSAWPDGSGLALPRAVRMTIASEGPAVEMVMALPAADDEIRALEPEEPLPGGRS